MISFSGATIVNCECGEDYILDDEDKLWFNKRKRNDGRLNVIRKQA